MLYRLLLYVVVTVVLLAPGRSAEAADIVAHKLQMQTEPTLPNGKIRIIKGTAGEQPDRFFLDELGVLTPVAVTVIALNKGDAVQIAFSQDRWDEVLEKHVTSATEQELTTKLRTQGSLQMEITSATGPHPYILIVWVGDEVKPEMAPVLVPMKQYLAQHPDAGKAPPANGPAAAKSGETSPVMIVIAVALVLIVVLLAVVVFRKKGRS